MSVVGPREGQLSVRACESQPTYLVWLTRIALLGKTLGKKSYSIDLRRYSLYKVHTLDLDLVAKPLAARNRHPTSR